MASDEKQMLSMTAREQTVVESMDERVSQVTPIHISH
jgi:hypothetical protein